MQFNKIILQNVGAYKGIHEINLTVTPPNNVILFGGKNGAGKTTLLNSIKICLFGAFTYGYTSDNNNYYDKIIALLNRGAFAENEKHYQIILEFTETENYLSNTYRFQRHWVLENSKPKELFSIMKNGKYLSDKEKSIYHSRLKENIPIELFNMCLFDGEEISRIVNNDQLADYLKSSSRVLFNLHLFSSLEDDLKQYIKQIQKSNSLNDQENALFEMDDELSHLYNQNVDLLNKETEYRELNSVYSEKIKVLKQDFEINGGLENQKRTEIQDEVSRIESIRESNSQKIKEFVATHLPFFITRELLLNVKEQMNLEQELETKSKVESILTHENLNNITKQIFNNVSNETTLELQDKILSLFSSTNPDKLHAASIAQKTEVEHVEFLISNIKINDYHSIIKKNQQLLIESKKLRDQLDIHNSTQDFQKMITEIETYSKEIATNDRKLLDIEIELEKLSSKIIDHEKQRDIMKAKLLDSKKSTNAFSMAKKVQKLSEDFRSQQTKKKLQLVQIEATKIFNNLLRKKNYISSITIDSDTFELTLYNYNHFIVNKDVLSSGEKQILLLSVICAMFKVAGIRFPFVFDTLLGRLDQSHRKTVLSNLIPYCSDQVLILSTDSEIDDELYNIVNKFTSAEFTMNFSIENESISITEGFFNK